MVLLELEKKFPNLMVLAADTSTSAGLDRFRKNVSQKYLEVGIAEQNMIGIAAGLASEGVTVFTSTFAPFQTMRCCEQIKVNLGYMRHKVNMVGLASGVVLGTLGYTHCSIEDVSVMRSIPNIIVTAPKDGNELRNLLYTGLDNKDGPFAIRYPKASSVKFDKSGQAELLPIGSWEVVRQGDETVILAVGPQVYDAVKAAENLINHGFNCEVVNCRCIKPMDIDYLNSVIERFNKVITIEEGVSTGGFGESVAAFLYGNGFKGDIKTIALPDKFVEHGPRQLLLDKYGVNQEGVESLFSISDSTAKLVDLESI